VGVINLRPYDELKMQANWNRAFLVREWAIHCYEFSLQCAL
jgi:hypothetical protein